MQNKPFAEVIESSLHQFQAQSWQHDQLPTYGALLQAQHAQGAIIGLVYQVETGSMDGNRYPFPFQKSQEQLKKEQPQIFEFLRSTFSCITLACASKGEIKVGAPALPAPMHAFVSPIATELRARLCASPKLLPRIFTLSTYIENIDELLIAFLEQNIQMRDSSATYQRFLQEYSLLIGNDYRRLKLFADRLMQT